jgi:Dinucleotide-utilizing enzymes involved in molybdopterin and thiamine biosynthesis family 2
MITGTIGSLQALEAVKLILNIGDTLSGRILTFDGLRLNFREIEWSRKANCPLCGDNATIKELKEYEIKCRLKI